jgi:hypothetical protein
MMRRAWIAAGCAAWLAAVTCAHAAHASDEEVDTMPLPLARAVADRTIDLVEGHALYPREQAEYAQSKTALLATVDGGAAAVDRATLYKRINALLATLDVDRHSFLVAPALPGQARPAVGGARSMPADLQPPTFRLITTGQGTFDTGNVDYIGPAFMGQGYAPRDSSFLLLLNRNEAYLNLIFDHTLAQGGTVALSLSPTGNFTRGSYFSHNDFTGDHLTGGVATSDSSADLPEPATLALFALGLLPLAARRRRVGAKSLSKPL